MNRLYVSRNGRGRELIIIGDGVDATICGSKEYTIKNKERLTAIGRNSYFNQRTNRKTTGRKTTVWIVQETNWRDCTGDDMDMVKEEKPQKRNEIYNNKSKVGDLSRG